MPHFDPPTERPTIREEVNHDQLPLGLVVLHQRRHQVLVLAVGSRRRLTDDRPAG